MSFVNLLALAYLLLVTDGLTAISSDKAIESAKNPASELFCGRYMYSYEQFRKDAEQDKSIIQLMGGQIFASDPDSKTYFSSTNKLKITKF